MLDCLSYPLTFPPYSSVKHLDGTGNFAVKKYYFYPWRYFYRHKIRMIEKMLRDHIFESLMDFGAGPGLMTKQWEKYAYSVYPVDKQSTVLPDVDMTICASVMEFVRLQQTFKHLSYVTKEIIIASPMKNRFTEKYFELIGDINIRNSHTEIIHEMGNYFDMEDLEVWHGLYFCVKGTRK